MMKKIGHITQYVNQKITQLFEKITRLSLLWRAVICLAGGVVGAFAFAPALNRIGLLAGFILLMILLNGATSKKQSALFGFLFGFGIGAVSLAWVSNALMIDNGSFAVFIVPALAGLGLFMGLFFLFPAWLASFAGAGVKRWVAFACWFVLFEWIRSWFLTGFPWNLIGSVWTDSPLVLQFASVMGVYGLSLITVLLLTAPALLPQYKPLGIMMLVWGMVLFGGWLRLYQAVPEDVFGVQLRLVQPNIAQTLKWNPQRADENLSTLIRLSRENNSHITHVIWPESAVPFLLELNESERLRLMGAVRQNATLITGAMRVVNAEKRQLANSIFIIDDMANITSYADKSHLVPFGEYVPLRGWLPLDKVVPIGADFVAGNGPVTRHIPKAPPASLLVCYEIIFPNAVVADKPKRPDWIINVTNDGWYGLSAGPYQHLGMAQLRAVEEGMPVVRVANTGISAVIDSYGRLLKTLPLGTQGVLDSPLPRAVGATFYALFGNIPLFVLCLLGIFWTRPRRKK